MRANTSGAISVMPVMPVMLAMVWITSAVALAAVGVDEELGNAHRGDEQLAVGTEGDFLNKEVSGGVDILIGGLVLAALVPDTAASESTQIASLMGTVTLASDFGFNFQPFVPIGGIPMTVGAAVFYIQVWQSRGNEMNVSPI